MTTPQGLQLAQINTPPTALQWNTTALAIAQQVGLPTTSWEPGGVERAIFAVVSNMMTQADIASSIAIQGGFVNFAAFGTVTFTDATGATQTIYVTPDPSIPAQNPTGALGWLDVLADGAYDVQRILATSATGALAITNTQATTYGPFAAGAYTVSQPNAAGAPTYTNNAALTIPQSATLGTVAGTSNSGGLVQLAATGTWTVGQVISVLGVTGTVEANGAWIVSATDGSTYVTLTGSTYANAWVSGGTIYSPTTAIFTATASGTGSAANALNVVTHPVTSLIGVTVGNYVLWGATNTEGNASLANRCALKLQSISPNGPKGAYAYFALSAITIAPTLTPAYSLSSAITRALITSSSGTVTGYLANANGVVSTSDVAAVNAVWAAYCVPVSVTATPLSATALDVTVLCTLYVPLAQATTSTSNVVVAAVVAYFAAFPIGGVNDPSGPSNILPIDGLMGSIIAACTAATITVQDITMTLNDTATNLTVGATQVCIFYNAATFAASGLTLKGY